MLEQERQISRREAPLPKGALAPTKYVRSYDAVLRFRIVRLALLSASRESPVKRGEARLCDFSPLCPLRVSLRAIPELPRT